MSTDTTTIDTMRRVAETLGLSPGSQFASGNIGRTLTGDITLSPRIIDLLLDLATGGADMLPKSGMSLTEEEVPEVLAALEIAAQVHKTCGDDVASDHYWQVWSDIANRETV